MANNNQGIKWERELFKYNSYVIFHFVQSADPGIIQARELVETWQ